MIDLSTISRDDLVAAIAASRHAEVLTIRSAVERAKEDGMGHEHFTDHLYDIECDLYADEMDQGVDEGDYVA